MIDTLLDALGVPTISHRWYRQTNELVLLVGIVASIFVGCNIGGSSTGIAWGAPVGAGIVKQTAAAITTMFVFLGGWTVGPNVVETLSADISTTDLPLTAGVALLVPIAVDVAVELAVDVAVELAVDVAVELGVEPFSFVLLVTFAACCSLATPVGYQTNLMVSGPGG